MNQVPGSILCNGYLRATLSSNAWYFVRWHFSKYFQGFQSSSKMRSKCREERKCRVPISLGKPNLAKSSGQFLRPVGEDSVLDPSKTPRTTFENLVAVDSNFFRKSYKDALLEKLPMPKNLTNTTKLDLNNNLVLRENNELGNETGDALTYSCNTPVKKAAIVYPLSNRKTMGTTRLINKKFPGLEMKARKIVVEVDEDESGSGETSDSDSEEDEEPVVVVENLDDDLYFDSASQCRADAQSKSRLSKVTMRFKSELATVGFKPKSEQLNDFLNKIPELRPGENLLETIGEPLELSPSETLTEMATKARLKYQVSDVVVLKHESNVEFKITTIAPWKKWCYHVLSIGGTHEQSKWISEEEILKKSENIVKYGNRYSRALSSKAPLALNMTSTSYELLPKPLLFCANGPLSPTKLRSSVRKQSLAIRQMRRCSGTPDEKQTPLESRGFNNDSSEMWCITDVSNLKQN